MSAAGAAHDHGAAPRAACRGGVAAARAAHCLIQHQGGTGGQQQRGDHVIVQGDRGHLQLIGGQYVDHQQQQEFVQDVQGLWKLEDGAGWPVTARHRHHGTSQLHFRDHCIVSCIDSSSKSFCPVNCKES